MASQSSCMKVKALVMLVLRLLCDCILIIISMYPAPSMLCQVFKWNYISELCVMHFHSYLLCASLVVPKFCLMFVHTRLHKSITVHDDHSPKTS